MDFQIGKMKIEDLPQVLEIEKQLFSEPWNEKMFLEELENHDAFVLEKREKIIGYICGWEIDDFFEITNVGIAPEFQRQSWGEKLVKFICEKENILHYFLEVRESNFAARKLYEKLGFHKVGVRKNYYHKPVENAVLMALNKKEG